VQTSLAYSKNKKKDAVCSIEDNPPKTIRGQKIEDEATYEAG